MGWKTEKMTSPVSKIVSVIETKQGDEVSYFTLEGVLIGGFQGGARIAKKEPKEEVVEEAKSGVVRPPTPQQVREEKDENKRKIIDRAIGDK
jgi:hypothetical protein